MRTQSDSVAISTSRTKTPKSSRQLYLKPENLQPIGSFKLRGAYNKVASLSEEERSRGVITYSSGNHAQGVAYAARALGVKAVIVMPENAPAVKREATLALGAEIILVGPASSERQAKAEELAAQHGYVIVPPYNDERSSPAKARWDLSSRLIRESNAMSKASRSCSDNELSNSSTFMKRMPQRSLAAAAPTIRGIPAFRPDRRAGHRPGAAPAWRAR